MRWILTVWLLATGCGELEFPAPDGGQESRQGDGALMGAGMGGTGAQGGSGGREPVQVPDGGRGSLDAGQVDAGEAQDAATVDAMVVDGGTAPAPTDCPVSGCLPELWSSNAHTSVGMLKYSLITLISGDAAADQIRVEGMESGMGVLIDEGGLLERLRADRDTVPQVEIQGVRTAGNGGYTATVDATPLPQGGSFRYLRFHATSDGHSVSYTWTLHGYEG